MPSTEWKTANTKEKKWYAGETISVAIGQGQVSVTPVSLAVYTATLANGGTRVTPHLVKAIDDGTGLKPVPPPPPQSKVDVSRRRSCRRFATACGSSSTAARHRRRARRSTGKDVCGKTGTAQVISNQGRAAARTTQEPARPRLVRVLRAARQPGDRRRRVPRARHPQRRTRRRSRTTFSRRTSRRRKASRCRRRRRTRTCASIYRDPFARSGGGARSAAATERHVRTPALLPHRLAAARRRSCCSPAIGLAMIYSTTYVTLPGRRRPPRARASGSSSTPSASACWR